MVSSPYKKAQIKSALLRQFQQAIVEQLSRLVIGNLGLVDSMSPVAAPCASAGSVRRNGNDWPRHRLGTSPQP